MMLYRFCRSDRRPQGFPWSASVMLPGVPVAHNHWKRHRYGVSTIAELDERRLVRDRRHLGRIGWHLRVASRDYRTGQTGVGGEPQTCRASDADPRYCRIHPEEASRHDDRRRWASNPGPRPVGLSPEKLAVTWCGDIWDINTWEGFLYLSFVEDLASRRILGVSMASHMRAALVGDALSEAVGTRGGKVTGVVFHSDRGTRTPLTSSPSCAHHTGVPVGGPHRSVVGPRSRRIVPHHAEERTRPLAHVS